MAPNGGVEADIIARHDATVRALSDALALARSVGTTASAGFHAPSLSVSLPARAERPVTFVEDRAILTALEDKGYGFERLFGVAQKPDLASLYANAPAYRAIVDLITTDIAALRVDMEAGGRPTYEKTALEKGRAFDVRWLQTDAARFRLVGVINRLDRRDFNAAKGEGGCGEVRFIYRLAYSFDYDERRLASRMPFNFNAVFTAAPSQPFSSRVAKRSP